MPLRIIENGFERDMTSEEETEFQARQQQAIDERNSFSVVPASVTNFQARYVLMQYPGSAEGRTLFDDINDWAQAQGGSVWQAWEYSNNITRNGFLVQQVGTMMGLSEEAIDALFVEAAQVEA